MKPTIAALAVALMVAVTGPVLAGNTPAWQMFDPIRSHGFTTYLLLACAVFYFLALRALRRAQP